MVCSRTSCYFCFFSLCSNNLGILWIRTKNSKLTMEESDSIRKSASDLIIQCVVNMDSLLGPEEMNITRRKKCIRECWIKILLYVYWKACVTYLSTFHDVGLYVQECTHILHIHRCVGDLVWKWKCWMWNCIHTWNEQFSVSFLLPCSTLLCYCHYLILLVFICHVLGFVP